MVELLLGKGASIDAMNEYNYIPLNLEIRNRHTGIVELLLGKAPIDAVDSDSNTPLHIAAKEGCPDTVELLLGKVL